MQVKSAVVPITYPHAMCEAETCFVEENTRLGQEDKDHRADKICKSENKYSMRGEGAREKQVTTQTEEQHRNYSSIFIRLTQPKSLPSMHTVKMQTSLDTVSLLKQQEDSAVCYLSMVQHQRNVTMYFTRIISSTFRVPCCIHLSFSLKYSMPF